MTNLELVEARIKSGFSFYVVKLPEEYVEDKLAIVSRDTGFISRMEYQNFLFTEVLVNLERLFQYLIETTGGDPEEQIKMRDEVELEIYKINPGFNPDKLVLTKSGVIKPRQKAPNGSTPLAKNPEWDRRTEEIINPYISVEEIEIMDAPPPGSSGQAGEGDAFLDTFETVEKRWDRTNLDLKVRKFTKNDLPFIFGTEISFQQELHYKIHIIQKCIDKADSVFALCDAMGLTSEVKIPKLAEELYQICIEVNPFLTSEEVDLDEIRTKGKANRRTARQRRNASKTKRGSGKNFSDITSEELLTLANRMKVKVIGQDEAIDKIVDTVQIASCGLRDQDKPIASYLMCGMTGVGKTLTAKVLAEELCGSRDNMVRIDCSEYTQQHDVQKLIGAPPSYVGYEDGGFLTNAVQENPFSVVLFDEIEKAHSKLFDLLLQIMDDARLTDGKGNVTDFRSCIILLTSNIGVSESEDVKKTVGFGDRGLLTDDRREEALKKALKNRFRPEFLNRIDETLSFRSLTQDDGFRVIGLLLEKVKEQLNSKQISAEFSKSVSQMIFDKGFSKKFGARPLQRTIDKEIVRPLAKLLLKGEIRNGGQVRIDFKRGQLKISEIKPQIRRRKTTTTIVKA